jgi:flagellar biosynthetic protein FlhB
MSDKTEAPTPRRLNDAREEGQVVRSVEINTAALILCGTLLLQFAGSGLVGALKQLIVGSLTGLPGLEINEAWMRQNVPNIVLNVLPNQLVIIGGVLLVGVAITVAQTGFLWSGKNMGFQFKRVNPVSGFKRIFSTRSLVELVKGLLKLVLVIMITYSYLQESVAKLLVLNQMDLSVAIGQFMGLALGLGMRVGSVYLAIAVADYAYQRWEFMRSMRMSKQEIKEEFKRNEGDPFLKSRIRGQQQRMARGRMMANVPKATVVVINPTHLALALEYQPGMAAPKLLAKGAHKIAERIVRIARENHIPTVQNIPLAHAIYRMVEVNQEVPPDLYKAIAEVLAYVYRLQGKRAQPLSAQPSIRQVN